MSDQVPRVGIGVMVLKGQQLLLGRRKGSHGAGEYAYPGGHLEHLETFEQCARREVREETGLEIGPLRFLRLLNTRVYAPKHYVDLAFAADWVSGEPRVLEPEKIDAWAWYPLDALPSPLFATIPTALEALREGSVRWWDGP